MRVRMDSELRLLRLLIDVIRWVTGMRNRFGRMHACAAALSPRLYKIVLLVLEYYKNNMYNHILLHLKLPT